MKEKESVESKNPFDLGQTCFKINSELPIAADLQVD